jgi:hypothetical protein
VALLNRGCDSKKFDGNVKKPSSLVALLSLWNPRIYTDGYVSIVISLNEEYINVFQKAEALTHARRHQSYHGRALQIFAVRFLDPSG